ncbi:MAG: N-acetyltransferase [Acidimicrobiales bacterium]
MEFIGFGRVHPSALVSGRSQIGDGVAIGPFAIIHENVQLGPGCQVGPQAILGEPRRGHDLDGGDNAPLRIGAGSSIGSGSVVYAGSSIGDRFQCGPGVTIGSGTVIGGACSVGTLSTIEGHCAIGDHTRLHTAVHVSPLSRIGSFVWLFPHVVLTNDRTPPSDSIEGVVIEDFAVVSAGSVLLPGVRIARHALVAAGSVVRSDVAAEAFVAGNPAKRVGTVRHLMSRETGRPHYPWPFRFERGMPWEGMGFARWAGDDAATGD